VVIKGLNPLALDALFLGPSIERGKILFIVINHTSKNLITKSSLTLFPGLLLFLEYMPMGMVQIEGFLSSYQCGYATN
jgi:hypothetical protein